MLVHCSGLSVVSTCTFGWRETLWSEVSCLRKQHKRQPALNQRSCDSCDVKSNPLTTTRLRLLLVLLDNSRLCTRLVFQMNRDKTELLVLKARHRPLPPLTSISVCDEEIDLPSKTRNIGVIFDTFMSMENHIAAVCKSAFYHLRNISRIRKYLSLRSVRPSVQGDR